MTPTFQGRNPGFPTRHRTERKRRRSVASRPPDAERGAGRPSPRHRNRGSPPAAPMAAGDKQIWAKMGSKWARGPCPDPDSRRPDPSRPPHPPRRSSTASRRTGAAPPHAAPGTYPRRPHLPPPAQARARAARHHGRSGELPPSRARPAADVSTPSSKDRAAAPTASSLTCSGTELHLLDTVIDTIVIAFDPHTVFSISSVAFLYRLAQDIPSSNSCTRSKIPGPSFLLGHFFASNLLLLIKYICGATET
jgi:hypothetical protein